MQSMGCRSADSSRQACSPPFVQCRLDFARPPLLRRACEGFRPPLTLLHFSPDVDRRKDRVETTPEQLAQASQDAERQTQASGVNTRVIGW